MFLSGPFLVIAAVFLQSVGKVAYGAYMHSISTAGFVYLSFSLAAVVFNLYHRRIPQIAALGLMVWNNFLTASAFLCFFFALKYLEPAIVGALEIGVSLITAMAITWLRDRTSFPLRRIVVCLGILAGCVLLVVAAIRGVPLSAREMPLWIPIAASMITGAISTVTVLNCKQLLAAGWTSGSILAHRFYLIIAVALVLALLEGAPLLPQDGSTFIVLLLITAVGIVLPMLLLQAGLQRSDPLTVVVGMASQPSLTFFLAGFSPAYGWTWLTFLAIAVLTLFVVLDMVGSSRATSDAQARHKFDLRTVANKMLSRGALVHGSGIRRS